MRWSGGQSAETIASSQSVAVGLSLCGPVAVGADRSLSLLVPVRSRIAAMVSTPWRRRRRRHKSAFNNASVRLPFRIDRSIDRVNVTIVATIANSSLVAMLLPITSTLCLLKSGTFQFFFMIIFAIGDRFQHFASETSYDSRAL